ncbi:MAG: TolC family protein [Planctomycetota bacterium]|jgi:outer membrane protein TolC
MGSKVFFLCMIISISAAINSVVYSQQSDVEAEALVTLQDYLRYAALNNAGLKAAFERWKAAVEQVPQAKSLPDPKFNYGYFIREVETRVGPQRQKFEIMQTFPWFGTLEARGDAAAAAAKAAHKRYEAKKLELFQQVKYAFYEYSYLAEAIEITNQNLELIKRFEEVARAKYAAAITAHPDIIRAQIELAVLEDRLKSLQELRPAIVAKLNSILNRPTSDELSWPKPPEYQPISIGFEQLLSMIIRNNPDLRALDYDIEAARNKEKLAKKKYYPNIGVGLSYIDTAHSLASGVDDSGKDPIIGMISLTLPIWMDNYKAAERQAKAQLRQRSHEKVEMENTLGARAQQLLYEFEDSDRKIELYRDVIIPKAEEMLIASESAYQSGTIDFLSLIDAQRMLLKYKLFFERSVAENAQKLAKLEMLAGTELPTAGEEAAEK